jgi:hypothetical protein
LQIAAGRIRFYVSNETTSLFFQDTPEIVTVGRWYFVVGVWDGTNYAIYVNGEIIVSGFSYPGKSQTTVTPVEIGKIDGWSWTYFDGIIDEVKTTTILERLKKY